MNPNMIPPPPCHLAPGRHRPSTTVQWRPDLNIGGSRGPRAAAPRRTLPAPSGPSGLPSGGFPASRGSAARSIEATCSRHCLRRLQRKTSERRDAGTGIVILQVVRLCTVQGAGIPSVGATAQPPTLSRRSLGAAEVRRPEKFLGGAEAPRPGRRRGAISTLFPSGARGHSWVSFRAEHASGSLAQRSAMSRRGCL
jgi:hypothetical protein